MYSEIIFVLNNQCDNEKQVKTSQDWLYNAVIESIYSGIVFIKLKI